MIVASSLITRSSGATTLGTSATGTISTTTVAVVDAVGTAIPPLTSPGSVGVVSVDVAVTDKLMSSPELAAGTIVAVPKNEFNPAKPPVNTSGSTVTVTVSMPAAVTVPIVTPAGSGSVNANVAASGISSITTSVISSDPSVSVSPTVIGTLIGVVASSISPPEPETVGASATACTVTA